MAQRISSLYKLVTLPRFYKSLHGLLGADEAKKRFVSEVIEPKLGDRVLDVGCGPASLFPYLPHVDYTGFDINPNHIAHAREVYGDRGRFLVGDATKDIGHGKSLFDLILVSALLHHLGDREAKDLLHKLCSFLKPGGRIVTMDSIWLPRQHPVAWTFNKLDSGLNVRTAEGYLELVAGLPVLIDTRTYRDFFRIPYDHFCMVLVRNNEVQTTVNIGQ